MSRVYLADDTRLGMRVAVKENLQTTAEARAQFEREARLLASLSHPNLPRVTDHFADASTGSAATGRQYLVMDYVEGEDLEAMIKRVGPLPEATALNWIRQILGAVEYLHAQNPPVIHRDIKPANIKVTPQGKAVLVDFGIAKSYDPRLATLTGARAVTPGYAPPEQYGMRTTERSDIYALGATLYTALTGRVPPEAPLRLSGEEALIAPSQIVPGKVSPSTQRAILQAMELETSKRWQSAGQMRSALEGQVATPPRPARPTVAVAKPSAPGRSGNSNVSVLLAGAVIGLALVVGLLAAIVVGLGQSTTRTARATTPAPTAVAVAPTRAPTAVSPNTPTPIIMVVTATSVPPTSTPTPTDTPRYTPTPYARQTRIVSDAPMVYVPAGEFTMGSNDYDWEKPPHTVYLDGFWIDKYEVTNALYKKCVDSGTCKVADMGEYDPSGKPNRPVVQVTWYDANTFCQWAGKRLPTEAEWEKAARGTDARTWPWGNDWNPSKLNSWDAGPHTTTDVGTYPQGASPYGALDMAGNVWEWVADWYSSNYYANSPKNNPKGPDSGGYRVMRGGSWDNNQISVRAA
ncbi:MAG: SUMF1/EgtB/PvdO family nonheme iron enzyme, partial [Chloroflexota bacterium]|nr:SUMF1/EgtB/PvdO family nonheme iron enzyme [Chloroflexota bacterium]